jgi:SAM-dependent methyltransferase
MDPHEYLAMAEVEATHPWFVNRRRLVRGLIRRFAPSRGPWRILDAGCGTGANLADYAECGRPVGLEYDVTAVSLCGRRHPGVPVLRGDLCRLPFAAASFDLVMSTDVIEHIEDDVGACREMGRVLVPTGRLILTTPAYSWAYSDHDRHLHHVRRYDAARLTRVIRDAGLRILHRSRYNVLLAMPLLAARLLRRDADRSDVGRPIAPAVAALFETIWHTEAALAQRLALGFGMTHVVVMERR